MPVLGMTMGEPDDPNRYGNEADEREAEERASREEHRERRVRWRLGRELAWQERNYLHEQHGAVDRVARRARLLRQGLRLVVLGRGSGCPNLWVGR